MKKMPFDVIVVGGGNAALCAALSATEHGAKVLILERAPKEKRDVPFDPNVKDGRCTEGLALPKSNWATAIEKPPFTAYSVGCGITFTFGGIKIDTTTRVLDMADEPLPGLYAGGEIVGGLFYFNYPSSSGLMAGAVFGRTSGREAAGYACGTRSVSAN